MENTSRKVTISWLPKNFDRESFSKHYNNILNPDEFISEKLRKHRIIDKDSNDKDKSPKYLVSITEAKQSFNNVITVFKLKKDIIDKIKNTKIEKMPNEIPELFTKPFIIETLDINDTLFADINCIVGYFSSYTQQIKETKDESGNTIYGTSNMKIENNGKMFSLLIHSNNKDNNWQDAADYLNNRKDISGKIKYLGYNIFEWQPYLEKTNWEFTRREYNRPIIMDNNFCPKCEHFEKCNQEDRYSLNYYFKFCFEGICDNVMSFITILNYLLKADNSPIKVENKHDKINRAVINKRKKIVTKTEDWIIRYMYIDKSKIQYEKNPEHIHFEKEGYTLKEVKVRGHLRNQAYGTEYKQHRWIYIESFASSKWIKEGDTKIIVSTN